MASTVSCHTPPYKRTFAARAHWLTVEWLPKYAPELNDIEVVWHDFKANHLAHQTFTDIAAMLHDRQTVSMYSRNVGGTPVDVSLVLAADCSGSISNEDLALQFHGYAEAVTSDNVINAVRSGRHGRIALTFVAWSSAEHQDQALPWTLVDHISAAHRFASALRRMHGPIPGYTSISGAIDFAARLLSTCDFQSERQVIDVSGDGGNNDGRSVTDARDDAVAAGITINGLPIIRQEPNIAHYYSRNVIGGPAAFLIVAQDIKSFNKAIREKLVTEIIAGQGDRGENT